MNIIFYKKYKFNIIFYKLNYYLFNFVKIFISFLLKIIFLTKLEKYKNIICIYILIIIN